MSTTVCEIELRYVSLGDVVDPINHRNVLEVTKRLGNKVLVWATIMKIIVKA